jgi:hypothetical protein
MLTSVKIGKQNGDTRTRKTEPVYLNLSNLRNVARSYVDVKAHLHDAIFAYDCCMQLADAIPATRIVRAV